VNGSSVSSAVPCSHSLKMCPLYQSVSCPIHPSKFEPQKGANKIPKPVRAAVCCASIPDQQPQHTSLVIATNNNNLSFEQRVIQRRNNKETRHIIHPAPPPCSYQSNRPSIQSAIQAPQTKRAHLISPGSGRLVPLPPQTQEDLFHPRQIRSTGYGCSERLALYRPKKSRQVRVAMNKHRSLAGRQ
jgi:hypothetical protein